ncbi:MAG TPA: NAD(P)H-binding protein [Oceanobacillus sp.]|nr:NAD(P)H-binding protein [Oceanobacillus sp.]
MARILVTGGAGGLGREIVSRLKATEHTVRVMSRASAPASPDNGIEWAQADVESGHGIKEAVEGVDIIVNSMTYPERAQQVDVEGTRKLLTAAQQAGVSHVVHISIVGIERIPTPYYEAKVAAEAVVMESGVPYSIWRATQFHTLLDGWLEPLRTGDSAPILSRPPDTKFQLLETGEAAEALLPHITAAPAGRLPDVGGPEVLTLDEIVRQWLQAQGINRTIRYLPEDPLIADAFRQGYNTVPTNRYGKITWADYLRQRYGGV